MKRAKQRQVPKRPHKPSSQRRGTRMLHYQHWRKAASLDRRLFEIDLKVWDSDPWVMVGNDSADSTRGPGYPHG